MIQKREPTLSPDSEFWTSLDWLLHDDFAAAADASGRPSSLVAAWYNKAHAAIHSFRSYPMLVLGVILAAIFGLSVWAYISHSHSPDVQPQQVRALPKIEAPFSPDAMRDLSRAEAVALNAATTPEAGEIPSADAFVLHSAQPSDYQRSLDCLSQAIYYEAGSEGTEGGRAVAQVVLNRVRHPAYPNTVCGVIYQGAERATGCQFTFACDGSLTREPSLRGWLRARSIAVSALAGHVYAPVGWSTHYHANYVVPYWAASLQKTATVGAHIFYRWAGNWGTEGAFTERYAGDEPIAALILDGRPSQSEDEDADGRSDTPTVEDPPAARPVLLGSRHVETGPAAGSDSKVRDIGLADRQIIVPSDAAGGSAQTDARAVNMERAH